ncbi:BlaI/MecI/CopY family transcriptional regulator [Clostridioides difficile]|uniref:BlaI/MecI/CopY family transcriptional regulator n=1 Tax=Clostridioides difficile TaxID=1496 RepID=UPI000D1DF701|nr:BlaI/MecI/CopY family transcriptional regulator [Clostridioides difficile]EGT3849443.1 BlaI/MecI/CopY family transcriptional regulator [Clostridioides difficile]EII6780948.1 BlaI/MecI/CopY family transcriptional regulator [Clostridioides difficile]EJX3465359.1 BlaI/MecI/CopY family transcriptional regulator [Clostridioides difficile]EKG0756718.1 BlaI/MecI/CopY family transcriptional regulator [Clostridioides difficile]EKG0783732.1 BlaI/MecI/CopY family transcriptional regulator [Clostridioi
MLNKKLPDSEFKIMKYMWNSGYKTATSKEVADEMEKEYSWKQTTTLTLLLRLTKRGFLASQKIGKHTHYTILIKEKEYLKSETKKLFGGLHNNPISNLISKLHDREEISNDKLDALEEWVRSWQEDEE